MPMPYTLTRGPVLTMLENALNPPADLVGIRTAALTALRDPAQSLGSILGAQAGAVAQLTVPGNATLANRLLADWLGLDDPPGKGTTGYWVGYQGDVESILREGMIRAIEVSLGITHDGDPAQFTRRWPIAVEWKCPNPYFEVWVTWRRHGSAASAGQVSALICTPPDKRNRLVTEPQYPPDPPNGVPAEPVPLAEPTTAHEVQGMWLVATASHLPTVADLVSRSDNPRRSPEMVTEGEEVETETGVRSLHQTSLSASRAGEWIIPLPATRWVDVGETVVVAPPPYAGGAVPGLA